MEENMKYVKIRAKNYNEALMQLRMKYGEDAIPISHKYVKEGGILGGALFAKRVVELTAAYQDRTFKNSPSPAPLRRKGIDLRVDDDVTKSLLAADHEESTGSNFLRELKKAANTGVYGSDGKTAAPKLDIPERDIRPAPARPEKPAGDIILSKEEYQNLKKLERDYSDIRERFDRLMEEGKGARADDMAFSEELVPYAELLEKNDFSIDKRRSILESVKRSLSAEELRDRNMIEKTLKDLVKSKIVVTGPIKVGPRRKILMFIGPTGVGKTTSLAKLGAIFSLREGKSVAFVTIDTYRIAATEQLKKYADIMKIPVHVVSGQKEFKQVIEKEKAEIVLVDTSGRSYRNAMKISEIKSYADAVDIDFERVLCVSASTKRSDLESIFEAFGKIEFSSVLVTKADETNYIGNIIDIADMYNKPISYIANGQEVPNDIMPADADRLADMVISGTTD
jgi:flagellar biosynthesis protein FlhF